MNLHQVLSNILEIANYPKNKRQEFIETFYEYYFLRLIDEMGGVDPPSARKLSYASVSYKDHPQKVEEIWREINDDEHLSKVVESVTVEVFGKLADDIAGSATEEQKKQILAILPP